jgi:prepilin-type N-terminal cleavage/methylation domain-containing protein
MMSPDSNWFDGMGREKFMRNRQGFTLVELLVAMALTLFIMLIMTQAFVISIDTFTALKGLGDMQENLRAGANILRFDLQQAHLEGDRRPSDSNLKSVPPTEGFLRVYQRTAQAAFGTTGTYIYAAEGADLAGGPSSALATNHVLHFASRLKGNQQQSFYSAAVADPTNTFFTLKTMFNMDPAVNRLLPGDATLTTYPAAPNAGTGIFRSQWAEIAYFLVQTGTSEEPLNPASTLGTPLYGLYRAQFVLVTDSSLLNPAYKGYFAAGNTIAPAFTGMACNQSGNDLVFITPNDVASGTRIFNPASPPTTVAALSTTRAGVASSLVVPNVVSFQVQTIQPGGITPVDLIPPFPASYDTGASPFVLQGVCITLRVWDNKTRQTRQLSMMQDL